MTPTPLPEEVAHIIQLAIAPVFTLAGIGALLNVMANRLARVVDRWRTLEASLPEAEPLTRSLYHSELAVLDKRMERIHRAISLSTAAALLICVVSSCSSPASWCRSQSPRPSRSCSSHQCCFSRWRLFPSSWKSASPAAPSASPARFWKPESLESGDKRRAYPTRPHSVPLIPVSSGIIPTPTLPTSMGRGRVAHWNK